MKRVGGWLSAKGSLPASRSLTALDEPAALQDALKSAAYIMNDENERAENELSKGTSPFHKLGRATTFFLRATLGFEKEMMEQTSAVLSEAEESAAEHHRRAVRDHSTCHQSVIYPAGAEYSLCQAEAQLMSAVIGVLNESLTESLRGFYKLRKAFAALQEIAEAENRYLDKHFSKSKTSLSSSTETASEKRPQRSHETSSLSSGVLTPTDVDDDEDLDFCDAEEDLTEQPTPLAYQGQLEMPDVNGLSLNNSTEMDHKTGHVGQDPIVTTNGATSSSKASESDHDQLDFRADVSNDPIDVFIHSGTSLCYGLLQLLLSMVPPAFTKILSILSFRGDRNNGFRLLWRATAFKENVNGALAGTITLGFHNVAIAQCDIRSREAYPAARLRTLLKEMRESYPKSVMWLLEEARMAMYDKEVEKAAAILIENPLKSPLKQVEAFRVFESGMTNMYLHRYEDCAKTFIKCVDMNNWSPGLYVYIAGACYVELYRRHAEQEPENAKGYKTKAQQLLDQVPSYAGKKRLMARQLPLDVFITRKLVKWTQRASARGCDMIDAIGVSPVEEMIYFWSGYRRMRAEHLQLSLQSLEFSAEQQPQIDEAVDERAILAVLEATCLRMLGKVPEAKAMLSEQVYCYTWHQIKACPHADNWPLPVAHYEQAVCLWQEAGGEDGDRATLQKCSDELLKVAKWEHYDLDARIGLKITTARETLTRCGIESHP